MKKKLTAMLLIMSLVCTFLPVSAMAAEAAPEAAVVSADGKTTTEHATLEDAINVAKDGDTVTLLKDVTTAGKYSGDSRYSIGIINKSITLDGQGKFILDVSNTQRGIFVQGPMDDKSKIKTVIFQNITIKNTNSLGRCIDTRGGYVSLNLDKVNLQNTSASNNQPLSIGGDHSNLDADYLMKINVKNSNIEAAKTNSGYGYGIITYNPVDLIIDNSHITGYSALHMQTASSSKGSVGSKVDIINGSVLTGNNPHSGEMDSYATICADDPNISVNVKDSKIVTNATGNAAQFTFSFYPPQNETGKVTISGNSFVELNGELAFFNDIYPTAQVQQQETIITGGEYTFDPSQYVDKSKYDVVSSTTPGYKFSVQPITVTDVKPAVGENIIDSNQMDANMSQEETTAITQAAETVTADTSKLGAVATEEKKNVTQAQKDAAPQALKDANIDTTGKDVNTFVQLYVEVAPITYDTDKKVLTLDVTPMKRVVAATTDDASKIVVNGEVGVDETANAAVVGKAQEINIQELTFSVTLPSGFVTDETEIYVQHKGEEFKNAITDDNGEKIVTFTTKNGFSPFTYSLTSKAVATIGSQSYTSLQAAVDAVKNGDTIVLTAENNDTVTVGREVSFILDTAQGAFNGKMEAGNGFILAQNGNTYTVTKASTGGVVVKTYTIAIDSAQGGCVSASHKRAAKNATVTVTATPDAGHEVENVTVIDKDGVVVDVVKHADGTYTFKMPAKDVTVKGTFKAVLTTLPFTDVHESDWFYGPVSYVYNNGIMNGTGDGTAFSPNVPLNRAMMAAVLYNLEGGPAVKNDGAFSDVPSGQWYTDAVNWAAGEGIVGGIGDGLYAPNANLTREQMASVLYRYAEYKGIDVSKRADLATFVDGNTVSQWATEVVEWAVAEKLINGTAGNTLQPQETATRAQVATVLMNFCENVAK